MAFLFYARNAGEKNWRCLNETYVAKFGGALVDSRTAGVEFTARLDGSPDTIFMFAATAGSFAEIAQAMLDAEPEAATKAFGKALAMGPRRPVYDEDGRELG